MAERVASVFLDSSNVWDRTFRKVQPREPVYITEYQWKVDTEYGGKKQKRHQRRYRELRHALRRLDYVLAKYEPEAAFILGFPVDIKSYIEKAKPQFAKCNQCGSTDFKFHERKT